MAEDKASEGEKVWPFFDGQLRYGTLDFLDSLNIPPLTRDAVNTRRHRAGLTRKPMTEEERKENSRRWFKAQRAFYRMLRALQVQATSAVIAGRHEEALDCLCALVVLERDGATRRQWVRERDNLRDTLNRKK